MEKKNNKKAPPGWAYNYFFRMCWAEYMDGYCKDHYKAVGDHGFVKVKRKDCPVCDHKDG